MRILSVFATFVFVAGITTSALAQSPTQVNLDALITVRRDVRRALHEINSAMPIYNGHRGLAMGAARQAETLLNAAVVANTPPAEPKPAAPAEVHPVAAAHKPPTEPKKEASAKAAPAAAKSATEAAKTAAEAPITPEELKAEEQKKIAESQARLRKGLEQLQQAVKDLKAAEASLSADDAAKVAKLLQTAQDESSASIELHAKEG